MAFSPPLPGLDAAQDSAKGRLLDRRYRAMSHLVRAHAAALALCVCVSALADDVAGSPRRQGVLPPASGVEATARPTSAAPPGAEPRAAPPDLSPRPPPTAPIAPPPPQRPRRQLAAWIAGGTAVAALAAGAWFGWSARRDERALRSLAEPDGGAARSRAQGAESKARTANVLYAIGGGAAAAGVTLFVLEARF